MDFASSARAAENRARWKGSEVICGVRMTLQGCGIDWNRLLGLTDSQTGFILDVCR